MSEEVLIEKDYIMVEEENASGFAPAHCGILAY